MSLLFPLFLLLLAPVRHDVVEPALPHEFYVSYGRMAVEGQTAVCRIRFFRDDLELAIGAFHRRPDFRISVSADADSLFLAYFRFGFRMMADGRVLLPAILGSGEEADMWWYTVEYAAPSSIRAVRIRNRLLFDVLPGQRNILKVVHFPDEKESTLYFVKGEEEHQVAF